VTGTVLQNAAAEVAYREDDKEYADDCARWRTIAKILVEAGATYDLKSACSLGDIDRVRVLIADRNRARDKDAMRAAASSGRAAIVKLLLEHGADPEDADYGGLPLSSFAIGHPEVLKVLFAAGANPKVILDYRGDGQGPQGSTLMHEAAQKSAVGSAEVLLENGVDVNAAIQWNGFTPLHLACAAGRVEMVDWLLRHKADPKASGRNGGTPMAVTTSEIRPEHDEDNARFEAIIRRLEKAGVETDIFAAIACNDLRRLKVILSSNSKAASAKDGRGQPALRQAVTLDRREMVTALLDAGCDPNIRSEMDGTGEKGETALITAAWWGRTELVKVLVARKANVNARADNGVTALHDAARMSRIEIVRFLLSHGADVNAKSDRGETPLDESACYGEHPQMAQLLRSHGGKGKESK
jgi:ankyrin repeat protein